MAIANPYRVLGIEAHASPGDVRRAYRDLALRFHPDRKSDESGERFVEIHTAYRLLSDPSTRADYDRVNVEYAERRHRHQFGAPLTLTSLLSPGTLLDDLFETFDLSAQGFVHEGITHGEPERLHYDLNLSPAEAARGGRFRFTIPLRRHCRFCALAGRPGCRACGGEGFIVDEHEFEVLVPPGVHEGARAELPRGRLGVPGGIVDVTVRIE